RRDNIEEDPDAAKNDRLHGVEADEVVSLFQNIENNSANERDARDRCRDVRRQVHRGWFAAWVRCWRRDGRRSRISRVWHTATYQALRRSCQANLIPDLPF